MKLDMNNLGIKLIMFLLILFILNSPINLFAQNIFYCPEGHFSFNLPNGWKRVSDEIIEKQKKQIKSFKKDINFEDFDFYMTFNKEKAKIPFEVPYFIILGKKTNIDERTIQVFLSSYQQILKKVFQEVDSISKLTKEVLIKQPIFDKNRKIILFSFESKLRGDKEYIYTTTVSAMMFYNEGIIMMSFYEDTKSFDKIMPTINEILKSFLFDKGFEYK